MKWPGSKWRIAEWIVGQLPPHSAYIEPYFGSGAVFFCKPIASAEIINDQDGAVVNLFRVIRDHAQRQALVEALALTPWARMEYDDCRTEMIAGDAVEQARRFLVVMWQAIGQRRSNGSIGSGGWRNRCAAGQNPTVTWHKLPERIHLAVGRLAVAQIENRPALDVIQRHRDKDVLLYIDPPYPLATRGRAMYGHEMSDGDHAALLDALLSHPGPVVLSSYMNRLYKRRLRSWKTSTIKSRAQDGTERTEVLWLNPVTARRLAQQRSQLILLAE